MSKVKAVWLWLRRRITLRGIFILWMITISVLIVGSLTLNRLEQDHRINDIQKSRRTSCEETYHSFPKVFLPFFPVKREAWTPKQKKDWAKLLKISDNLANKCSRQVKSKGGNS